MASAHLEGHGSESWNSRNSFDAVRSRLTRLTRGFIIWEGPRTQPITNSRRGISRPQLQLHDEGSAPRVEPRDSRFRHTPAFDEGFPMEAYIPLLCLVVIAALLWRRALSGSPIFWTRGRVVLAAAAVLGALVVPVVIAAVLRG